MRFGTRTCSTIIHILQGQCRANAVLSILPSKEVWQLVHTAVEPLAQLLRDLLGRAEGRDLVLQPRSIYMHRVSLAALAAAALVKVDGSLHLCPACGYDPRRNATPVLQLCRGWKRQHTVPIRPRTPPTLNCITCHSHQCIPLHVVQS